MTTIHSKMRRLATSGKYLPLALLLTTIHPAHIMAQDTHSHDAQAAADTGQLKAADPTSLVGVIRTATARFKDVAVAKAEGYQLTFGCVSGPDAGAMGMHYVNMTLVNSGVIDPNHPQIVIYEPKADGTLQLIGADFLIIADQWNATHSSPPQIMGQWFQYFEAPNRFGLPAFYTLHVWAWKNNPSGDFVNWHPHVTCNNFTGK